MLKCGIDISDNNRDVDDIHLAVDKWGLRFAILKATEGANHLDPTFRSRLVRFEECQVLPAAYHFARSDVNARDQAAWFLRNIPNRVPRMIDWERDETGHIMDCGNLDTLCQLSRAKVLYFSAAESLRLETYLYRNPSSYLRGMRKVVAAYHPAEQGPPHLPEICGHVSLWQQSDHEDVPGLGIVDAYYFMADATWLPGFWKEIQ